MVLHLVIFTIWSELDGVEVGLVDNRTLHLLVQPIISEKKKYIIIIRMTLDIWHLTSDT